MSEDINTEDAAVESSDFDKLQDLVDQVKIDGPKGLEGNKQAARRARGALNDIKKICTPLRLQIQEAVKKPK